MSLLSPLVPAFPNNLTNGTPADASQVMADFNNLRNAINNTLSASGATGGDQYVGLTTDSRFNGTSVHDALTQLIDRQSLYTDTGTTNAIVITPNPAMPTLAAGQVFWFKAANTTTSGSATITIGSNSAVGLANQDGTLLLAGAIIAGSYYQAVTAGPGNAVRILDPSRITGSFTGTIATGCTTTPTGTINLAIEPSGKAWNVWAPTGWSGTSNANFMTISGIPSSIQTATDKEYYASMTNNGATGMGGIRTGAASGTWTCLLLNPASGAIGPSNFVNSAAKGIPQRFAFTSCSD